MSDWQVGDLALCLLDMAPLRPGAVYTVAGLHVGREGYWDEGELGLFLAGVELPSPSGAARAFHFRKIAPHQEDGEDRQTIWLLQHLPQRELA